MVSNQEKRTLERNIFPYPVDFEMADLGPEETKLIRLTADGIDISSSGIGLWTTAPLTGVMWSNSTSPFRPEHHCPSFSEVRWVEPGNIHSRVGLQFLA